MPVRIQVYSVVQIQVNDAALSQVSSVRLSGASRKLVDLSTCNRGAQGYALGVVGAQNRSKGMQNEPLIGLNSHQVEEAGFVP